MDLSAKLAEDMKSAMKSGDKVARETIRSLRGSLKNAEIEKGTQLQEEEVSGFLRPVLHVLEIPFEYSKFQIWLGIQGTKFIRKLFV